METAEKKSPLLKEEKAPEQEAPSAQLQVSLVHPEMAMLQGGLFVIAIPLNSKAVTRVVASGVMAMAVHKLQKVYDEIEANKAAHEARKKVGDLSLTKKLSDGFNNLFK